MQNLGFKKQIICLLFFFSLLRLPLFDRPLQHDEIFKTFTYLHDAPFYKNTSGNISTDPSWSDDWRRQIALHPPFMAVFYYFWIRIFGDSEISLRVPTVLVSVAGIVFLYFVLLWTFDEVFAFWVVLATIFSVSHIGYSTMAVHVVFERAVLTGSLFCLAGLFIHNKKSFFPVLFFLNVLGVLIFYHYLVYLGIQTLIFIWYREKLNIPKIYFIVVGLFFVFAAWLIFHSFISGYFSYDFWMENNALNLLQAMMFLPFNFSIDRLGTSLAQYAVGAFCFCLFIFFCIGGIFTFQKLKKEKNAQNLFKFALLTVIIVPFVCYAILGFFIPRFGNSRNFAYLLSFYYVYVFIGLRYVFVKHRIRIFVKIILSIVLCFSAVVSVFIFHKYKWIEKKVAVLASGLDTDFEILVTTDSFIQAHYAQDYGIYNSSFIFASDNFDEEEFSDYLKQCIDKFPEAGSFAVIRKTHEPTMNLKDQYNVDGRIFCLSDTERYQENRLPLEFFDKFLDNHLLAEVSVFREVHPEL